MAQCPDCGQAVCDDCGAHQHTGESCIAGWVEHEGVRYLRIRYGDPGEKRGVEIPEQCHDCGVKLGGYHHLYCDNEVCPVCGDQLLYCGHGAKEEDNEAATEAL